MKVFWFLVALVLFVGSFALFGYSFQGAEIFAFLGLPGFPFEIAMFTGGILAVTVSLLIPFQLLEKLD